MGIPTIEIDLSKIDRNISEQELQDILINENEHKVWIYNGKREAYYEKFLKVSEVKPVITRNYALHVDNCPIGKRVWKCNRYANLLYDCQGCDYLIGYESTGKIIWSKKVLFDVRVNYELHIKKTLKFHLKSGCKILIVKRKKEFTNQ